LDDPLVDSREIGRVARVQRQVVGDGRCRDQDVVCAGGRFADRLTKRSCDPSERSGRGGVEWQCFEICFGLLQIRLTGRSFASRAPTCGPTDNSATSGTINSSLQAIRSRIAALIAELANGYCLHSVKITDDTNEH